MENRFQLYSGTSNIVLPIKQSDYPPQFKGASRLTYYASLHSSVEINSSFYKIPKPATVAKWQESVPPHFRFTFKLPKTVTHAKGLQFNTQDLDTFTATVAQAGDKKGCLLVQLPPSVKIDRQESLEGILETLNADAKGWHIAVEFRDPTWYNSTVYRMLQHFNAGMVEQDMPRSATPRVRVAEDFQYLRFHGPEGTYRGSYADEFLAAQAERIATWLKEGRQVYVYFNNTLGNALGNEYTLRQMLAQALAGR
ncbi:MAG TPA: DUF72 domain-containing protein [Flavisolibacter sp.]|jgi:uncharacterized protein YecE (DUF72 family)|nr:DUF72 domain-containing protein [Flavisolibacter sp.]